MSLLYTPDWTHQHSKKKNLHFDRELHPDRFLLRPCPNAPRYHHCHTTRTNSHPQSSTEELRHHDLLHHPDRHYHLLHPGLGYHLYHRCQSQVSCYHCHQVTILRQVSNNTHHPPPVSHRLQEHVRPVQMRHPDQDPHLYHPCHDR